MVYQKKITSPKGWTRSILKWVLYQKKSMRVKWVLYREKSRAILVPFLLLISIYKRGLDSIYTVCHLLLYLHPSIIILCLPSLRSIINRVPAPIHRPMAVASIMAVLVTTRDVSRHHTATSSHIIAPAINMYGPSVWTKCMSWPRWPMSRLSGSGWPTTWWYQPPFISSFIFQLSTLSTSSFIFQLSSLDIH